MRLVSYALVLLAFSLVAACTADNPSFCDAADECGAGAVCDLSRKECVAPADVLVECETPAECTMPDEPICDATLGLCRACSDGDAGDGECRALGTDATRCVAGACVECASATDCPAQEPACGAQNSCEPCDVASGGDAACAARDGGALPLCGADGECVECREGADCDSTLCDEEAGRCIDSDAVVFAAPNGADSASCGAFDGIPCQTLGGADGAIAKLDPGEDRIYVRLAPGLYQENAEIRITAVILGDGADLKSDADGEPVLTVVDSDVELRGLTIRDGSASSDAHGIECSATTANSLRLVGATVSGNEGRGILANDCDVSVVSSTLRNNDGGGLLLRDGNLELVSSNVVANDEGGAETSRASSVYIVNNFFTRNGNVGARIGALLIETGDSMSPSTFEFNTIVGNTSRALLESGAIVACSSQAITASHNLVYNNINGDSAQVVGICTLSFSNIEGGDLTNNNIDEQPVFVDASGGDYHLAPGSPGIDQGAESSAIVVDIDGDARPQGARLDIGADEVPPDALMSTSAR